MTFITHGDVSDILKTMKVLQREKALELRIKHELGYSSIAKQISVSKSTLARWLKHLPLSHERITELRRKNWSNSEAHRERIRETKRKKREERENELFLEIRQKFKKIHEQALFVAGLMLYQAEGDKRNDYHIGLANTDPEMIKFFIWWLEKFMHIPKKRMKGLLHLYENMDLSAEKKFWILQTGFSRDQFYKDQIRSIQLGSFSYSESFRHGTCKVYVNGVKEKTELSLSIKAFFDTYKGLVNTRV